MRATERRQLDALARTSPVHGGQDLRSALDAFEAADLLLRVGAPISWDFEAAAVLWKLDRGPAVIFENVEGYDVPIVGNVLNDRDKLAVSLGLEPKDAQQHLVDALDHPVAVEEVQEAPCQEQVLTDDLDVLELLPVPRISEHDAGRYISAGVVISCDPDTGRQNMAIARIHARGGDRLGCYFAPTHTYQFLQRCRELGRPLEIAVVIGAHPAVLTASQLLVPGDELEFAGAFLGAPLQVARCRTVDLRVPAGAEIVLEGFVDPNLLEEEGPFGEFPGTYAPERPNPVIQLRAVTMREQPIFQMIVGGDHPEHLITGGIAREATLYRAVRAVVPGVQAVAMPEGGSCRFHAVISIAKRVEGEGKLAALAALSNQDLLKRVIVVDSDIDVYDPVQVEWALATRMRAHRDITLIEGVKSNPVDPMSVDRTITKVAIDATLDLTERSNALPKPTVPVEVSRRIEDRWGEIVPGTFEGL